MTHLHGRKLEKHLDSLNSEIHHGTLFGHPLDKAFKAQFSTDLSCYFQGRKVSTPLGPAAGPHTQLAQNIVRSFLAGGRIIELKTVQILDQLEIPRPCIDARNITFNVEWSQELSLEESLKEYVRAWILLKIIEEEEWLGVPKGDPFYEVIFDMSVGYDLKGISDPKICDWIRSLRNADNLIQEELQTLPERYSHYRKLEIPSAISSGLTLSTFHGCPRDEIEKIVQYLMEEHQLGVIVKMNPTMLGLKRVQEILHEKLDYTHVKLDPEAFNHDLSFDEGIQMMKRLQTFAKQKKLHLGAKFTNTLIVKGENSYLPGKERYLSGPPLHVIALELVEKFREKMGADFPVSFSAGVDSNNVFETVACNLVPVSMCTDLLKKGGYTRLFKYIQNLDKACQSIGAKTLKQSIFQLGSSEDMAQAGQNNLRKIVQTLADHPHYHLNQNYKAPRKKESELKLFDCLNCHICEQVCPNGANFHFTIPSTITESLPPLLRTRADLPTKEMQIGNIADFCNECSNCDTHCPEHGGPYKRKPRFFTNLKSFQADQGDGYFFHPNGTLEGRVGGKLFSFCSDKTGDSIYFTSDQGTAQFDGDFNIIELQPTDQKIERSDFSLGPLLTFQSLHHGLTRNFNYGPSCFQGASDD